MNIRNVKRQAKRKYKKFVKSIIDEPILLKQMLRWGHEGKQIETRVRDRASQLPSNKREDLNIVYNKMKLSQNEIDADPLLMWFVAEEILNEMGK